MYKLRDLLKGAERRVEMPLDLAAEYQSSGYPLMGSSDKAPEPESTPELNPPKRIGDLPPVPYIDNTFNVLSSRHEKFCDELGALSRDIEKLVTERNQLTIAIDAIEAAMRVLENGTSKQDARKPATVVAEYHFNEGVNSAGEPANGSTTVSIGGDHG